MRVALLILCALPLAGCLRSAAPPTLTVTGARVVERSAGIAVVEFDIAARNDNDIELPLRNVRYSLSLEGETVFTGSRSPEATIRRFGSQSITLPVVVPLESLPADQRELAYRLSGRITYLVPGALAELLFDSRVSRPTASFEDRGTLELMAD